MLVLIQLFLRGKGGVKVRSQMEDRLLKKPPKNQTKKTKTKGRKIKKRETNKNTQLLVFNL